MNSPPQSPTLHQRRRRPPKAQKPKIIMGGNGDKWVDPETTDESRIRLGLLVVVELEEVMVGFDVDNELQSETGLRVSLEK
mmetsp:Transcript_3885/g.6979  ORF Transcript_3885/g.6979 Transcript_3885/m.6979 type:complete len:81 (-) Transcript_3885:251-493(-)